MNTCRLVGLRWRTYPVDQVAYGAAYSLVRLYYFGLALLCIGFALTLLGAASRSTRFKIYGSLIAANTSAIANAFIDHALMTEPISEIGHSHSVRRLILIRVTGLLEAIMVRGSAELWTPIWRRARVWAGRPTRPS